MRKQTRGVSILAAILLASGCVSYEPDPIDVAATARAFEEATPERALQNTVKEFDLSNGVSVSEARLIALARNPGLLAERAKIGIAEAQLISAGIIPNPSFGLGWLKNQESGSIEPSVDMELFQSVRSIFNRGDRKQIAQAGLEQARAGLAHKEWLLVKQVEAAFYEAVYLRARLNLANQAVTLFERVEEVARKRVKAGDATKLDVNLARIERYKARKERMVAGADLRVAKQQLSSLLGLAPSYDLQIEKQKADPGHAPVALAMLQSFSLKHRQDLAEMLREYQGAERALRLAIRKQFPDFQIGLLYERETEEDAEEDWLGFGLEIELPLFDWNQGGIAEKRAERKTLKSEVAAQILQIKTEVTTALTKYRANRELLVLFTQEVLPSLDENLRLLQKSFEAGEAGVLLVITSQEKILGAKASYLEAVLNARKARLELEKAIGGNLENAMKDASGN